MKCVFVYLVVFLMTVCSCKSDSWKVQEKKFEFLQIYLEEFDTYFLPDSCKCKMVVQLHEGGELKIDMMDCKGMMVVNQFDSMGSLVAEGKYLSSIDTLKKYSIGKSAIDGSRKVYVVNYFQPLPDGIWKYYKRDSVLKTIEYSIGVRKNQ